MQINHGDASDCELREAHAVCAEQRSDLLRRNSDRSVRNESRTGNSATMGRSPCMT